MTESAGWGSGLASIARTSDARSRSISPENLTGATGSGGTATDGTGARAARDLGRGWKVSPSIDVPAGATTVLAEVEGAGVIEHLWITARPNTWRSLLLRMHWEGDDAPAVEVPLGDFFCNGWGVFSQVASVPVAVNPYGGFNSYWSMPFRRSARITLENLDVEPATVYYQVDYSLTEVPDDAAHLHAQWRRSNPVPYGEVHTILDRIEGQGQYVGTYLAWGVNNNGWWGEGELKFFLDGDQDFPTICGTGTEDYFGGAWNFDVPGAGYTTYSTPYLGMHQALAPDGVYKSQQRFGMYRWHLPDPVRFRDDLKVTVQALGWRSGRRYLPLQDDVSSTAVFYLRQTSTNRPPAPDVDTLEVV